MKRATESPTISSHLPLSRRRACSGLSSVHRAVSPAMAPSASSVRQLHASSRCAGVLPSWTQWPRINLLAHSCWTTSLRPTAGPLMALQV
eukprot:scaffold84740_cov75-Phaeocystis_antarctica.AAC.9